MEHTFDLLIDCNIKLDFLRTKDYRFVAWIIYSTKHKSFIAGVDTYSNDEQNLQFVIIKAKHTHPGECVMQIHETITNWHMEGFIPLEYAPFFE